MAGRGSATDHARRHLVAPAKRRVREHGPQWLLTRVGPSVDDVLDLSVVEHVRRADPEQLRDPAFLEHELLPRLGLVDGHADAFPPELQPSLGRGLHAWQWPNQLAPYLALVAARPVRTYLEVGVFRGGTFIATVEVLRRVGALRRAVAVDVLRLPAVARYAATVGDVEVRRHDTTEPRFARFVAELRPDLVLIDGDHSEAGCRHDLEAVRDHANLIAFHDVSEVNMPGVGAVWRELKGDHAETFAFHEFTAQYALDGGGPHLGIGVAERRQWRS